MNVEDYILSYHNESLNRKNDKSKKNFLKCNHVKKSGRVTLKQ
jgi:hypothetical protein